MLTQIKRTLCSSVCNSSGDIISCNTMPCPAMLFDSKIQDQTKPNQTEGEETNPLFSKSSSSIMSLPNDPSLPSFHHNARSKSHNHQAASHCLRRLVSRGPISGLPLRFPSGRFPPSIPIEGSIGPGLGYPPAMDIDMAYAGVLYGLTPVVISATLGNIWPPRPIPIPMPPPPIAANARPSLGLAGGTDRGVLSLRAAIVRAGAPPTVFELELPCTVGGLLYRPGPGPGPGGPLMTLDCDWLCECPRDGDDRWLGGGASVETLDSEKGTTPARRAMSASPSCQCIASAALQGTAISSATLDHISGLNLSGVSALWTMGGCTRVLLAPR